MGPVVTRSETSSGEQAGVETARLLVLDDDEVSCRIVGEVGKKAGFEVELAFNGPQFQSTFASFEPTVIVLDLVLPETDGVELLRFLAEQGFDGRLILVSGTEPRVLATTRRLAISRGLSMAAVHRKPVEPFELESSLRACLPGADVIGEEDLLRALERDELVLEYQPQVRWHGDTSLIEATEALVRWNRPGYGLSRAGPGTRELSTLSLGAVARGGNRSFVFSGVLLEPAPQVQLSAHEV